MTASQLTVTGGMKGVTLQKYDNGVCCIHRKPQHAAEYKGGRSCFEMVTACLQQVSSEQA